MVAKQKLVNMYRTMVRIRTFEERAVKEFALGNIAGSLHLYSGQEAIAVGACANLRSADYITSTHRGHGHLIAKGGKTERMMAELFGRKAGYCKGKGGSMHIADPEIGILGANGIVGAGITIANGAALATQLDRTDQVTICFFGDGACNTTRFHEGINLASIWNLPVIYVIENNMYAETTHVSRVCKLANLAERAYAYGIPGETVDGNDVLAVYEAVSKRVRRARRGKGASIIECKTCRWHGHDEGDQQTYRTKEEITECKKRDPILRFKRQLLEKGILTEHKIEQINREINDEIEKAVEFALESPFPAPEETLEDVYA